MVLECAGFLPATPEGLQYLRRSGTFVEVGHFVDMGSLDFTSTSPDAQEPDRRSGVGHPLRALRARDADPEKQEFPFADLVSHILPLDEVKNGFQALNGDYRLGGETVIKIAVQGSAG